MNRLSRGTLGIFLLALIPALSLYSARGEGARSETSSELPFYAEESSPLYTLLAVKALILSGMLAREDLEPDVKAYAA